MAVDPEEKFGIKIQTSRGPKTLAQKYSLVAGVFYPFILPSGCSGSSGQVSAAVPR